MTAIKGNIKPIEEEHYTEYKAEPFFLIQNLWLTIVNMDAELLSEKGSKVNADIDPGTCTGR